MSKDNPDPTAFTKLRKLINDEEDRTRQYARQVRISKKIAKGLVAMEAEDWLAASNGFTDLKFCNQLASDFLRQGVTAANGLAISIIGPVLVVAEDPSAPEVEITIGISWPE